MLSQVHRALLLAAMIGAITGADFTPREDTIRGEVYDASSIVAVTVSPDDASPAIQREYLVDVTYGTNPPKVGDKGAFSLPTKFIPGRTQISVRSATAVELRRIRVAIPNPRLNVRLEWAGNDHDYDLYVNSVNWTSTSGEGGKLDKDSYAGTDSGKGLENILFEQASPGIYKVYVNYYSDHGNGGADPTTVTITLGSETIFKETFTINDHEGHGSDLSGGGKSVWNVATVVVHANDAGSGDGKAAAFRVVDDQWNVKRIGYRDMFTDTVVRQNGKIGIFPRTNYQVTSLDGPSGTSPVVIAPGQSVQFYAAGTVNSEGTPQARAILGKYQSSDTSIAAIDDLGVLTGFKVGKTIVSAYGGGYNIEVYVVSLDLDVDSDNTADPFLGLKTPSRSEDEDKVEWPFRLDHPGLVLITNRGFEEGGYVEPTNPTQDKDRDGIVENDQDLSRGVLEVNGQINVNARHQGDDSLARLYIQIGSSWQAWPSGGSKQLSPGTYSVLLEGIKAGVLTTKITLMSEGSSSSSEIVDDKVKVTVIDPHYQVDRSRDEARQVTDRGLDLTTVNHEMRFWLNNGNNGKPIQESGDGYSELGEDPTNQNDGDNVTIKNQRVLDNFERMLIVADGCGFAVNNDTVRLFPRWVKAPGSDLRLSFFPVPDGNSTTIAHLNTDPIALRMKGKERLTSSNSVDGINERLLPNAELKKFINGDALRYPALWCATGGPRGKGWSAGGALIREKAALGMVVHWKINGAWRKVAWYRHLHLSLSDIRASIVHWSAGDVETTSTSFPTPTLSQSATTGVMTDAQPPGNRYYGVQDPDVVSTLEKNTSALLFVHGYRMPRWERREFPSCHFKRLYWQRYGGSMGMFSWPTEYWANPYVGGALAPQNYDRSEFQARRSGAMVLAGLLPNVPAGLSVSKEKLSIMAHSMGNVVLSEALRASSGTVGNTYFSMMSAESAGCYRYSALEIGTFLSVDGPNGVGPDVYRHANPQDPRSRLTWDQFNNQAPFEPLQPTQDGPVYYSGVFARCFTNTRTYFREGEAATANSWVGTQNQKPDVGFSYQRTLKLPSGPLFPEYSDHFSQTHYGIAPFSLWPTWPDQTTAFFWRFAPSGADQFSQNAAVMAFVVGSPTMAVGATPNMNTPSPGYPNQECLFGQSINLRDTFGVGTGEYDHSFPWNYWSAMTWNMHKHLMEAMP